MTQKHLNEILFKHNKWLNKEEGGERADLTGANLTGADLTYANLTDADLRGANLRGADLIGAGLRGANLTDADLRGANLRGADLIGADLRGANIDYSCLPLWCGGLNFKIDESQAKQLMYHVINLMQYSNIDTSKLVKKNMFKWLEDSHLVTKHHLPILKEVINNE